MSKKRIKDLEEEVIKNAKTASSNFHYNSENSIVSPLSIDTNEL